METVTSKDGTTIAYDRVGDGPALVLVSGASVDRGGDAGFVPPFAENFTVYNYDRRGRGDSGDTAPYAAEREIEDLAAVIAAAGGSAAVLGFSSGAALAASGRLDGYHLLPATRADLLRRLDRRTEAAEAYREAIELAGTEPERRYLERRAAEVSR